jgi:hypothetical protein
MINKAVAVNPKILTSIKKIFLFFEYCFSSYLKNNIFSQCGISFFSHIFFSSKEKKFSLFKKIVFCFSVSKFFETFIYFFSYF